MLFLQICDSADLLKRKEEKENHVCLVLHAFLLRLIQPPVPPVGDAGLWRPG